MEQKIELKIFLMKHGITRTKLAEETGLHLNTICKLVSTGECTKSTKELVRLYLGLDKTEFSNLLNG
jgi:DNA-binding Xre family transcriptional regulator